MLQRLRYSICSPKPELSSMQERLSTTLHLLTTLKEVHLLLDERLLLVTAQDVNINAILQLT